MGAAVPLLAWAELRDAERVATDARSAWRAAQVRYWKAPRGAREKRLRVLSEAAQASLRADADLVQAQLRAGL